MCITNDENQYHPYSWHCFLLTGAVPVYGKKLCSRLLLYPTTLLSSSWRSSFIYLAFLRFCWLLLCGDQRKQVTRYINSQFNKFSNKKQKVHRTCCRSLLVINQIRYIVMLSAPHVYLTTKIVTNEYLHGVSLKVKHSTYSSIPPYWDVCVILCSGPKPTFRSRRRGGIFYYASPDLPKWFVATIGEPRMNTCMEQWQGIGARALSV